MFKEYKVIVHFISLAKYIIPFYLLADIFYIQKCDKISYQLVLNAVKIFRFIAFSSSVCNYKILSVGGGGGGGGGGVIVWWMIKGDNKSPSFQQRCCALPFCSFCFSMARSLAITLILVREI